MIRNSNCSPLQVNAIHASGLNFKMKKKDIKDKEKIEMDLRIKSRTEV